MLVVSLGDCVGSTRAGSVVWELAVIGGLFTLARTFLMKLLVFTKGDENGLRRFSERKVEEFSVTIT